MTGVRRKPRFKSSGAARAVPPAQMGGKATRAHTVPALGTPLGHSTTSHRAMRTVWGRYALAASENTTSAAQLQTIMPPSRFTWGAVNQGSRVYVASTYGVGEDSARAHADPHAVIWLLPRTATRHRHAVAMPPLATLPPPLRPHVLVPIGSTIRCHSDVTRVLPCTPLRAHPCYAIRTLPCYSSRHPHPPMLLLTPPAPTPAASFRPDRSIR